jgi:hypothetical protein
MVDITLGHFFEYFSSTRTSESQLSYWILEEEKICVCVCAYDIKLRDTMNLITSLLELIELIYYEITLTIRKER